MILSYRSCQKICSRIFPIWSFLITKENIHTFATVITQNHVNLFGKNTSPTLDNNCSISPHLQCWGSLPGGRGHRPTQQRPADLEAVPGTDQSPGRASGCPPTPDTPSPDATSGWRRQFWYGKQVSMGQLNITIYWEII